MDRFVKFADWTSKDPFRNGILCGPDEAEIEQPKVHLRSTEEVVEFFLQNSKDQLLFARISRLENGKGRETGNIGDYKRNRSFEKSPRFHQYSI